jgi:hypothetical protein
MAKKEVTINQLRFVLSENQKKELIIKHERIRKILLDKKIVKNEKQLNNYSEYKKLSDYERYCLLGNNYWLIMNGEYDRFTCVPIEDLHFWHYFNETCFIECDAFQIRKKENEEERRKNEVLKIDDEFKIEPKEKIIEPEQAVEIKKEPEPEPIIEIKPEPETIKLTEEMPMEENNDFLKEKQEHPKYDKKEIEKRIDVIKADNAEKKEAELKKKVEDKKTKKIKKGKNEDQQSLFQ